jgi:hypothetical protein
MGNKSSLAALGGCLGVVAGMSIAGVVGFMLADSYQPASFLDLGRLFIFSIAIALGAVGGATIGAGLAVRLGANRGDSVAQAPSPQRRPPLTCSGCGQANDPDARFCNKCGSSLEQSGPNQPLRQTCQAITTPRPSVPPHA